MMAVTGSSEPAFSSWRAGTGCRHPHRARRRLRKACWHIVSLAAVVAACSSDQVPSEPERVGTSQAAVTWSEMRMLAASDAADGDRFGAAVAVSGNTVAVGAVGANGSNGGAYVFERGSADPASWTQSATLAPQGAAMFDSFGEWLAISGDTVILGNGYSGGNEARVFERDQGGPDNWGEVKTLTASGAALGVPVALDGDVAILGAFADGPADEQRGSAYVRYRDYGGAENWGQVAKLTASDGAAGEWFGRAVALSGDTVVVGAPTLGDPFLSTAHWGGAYVFQRDEGGADHWGQVKAIVNSDPVADDVFGYSVAIDGDTIAIGAPHNGPTGAVYVFERDQGGADNWGQVAKLTGSESGVLDWFGGAVSVSGDIVLVGEPGNGGCGTYGCGAVYLFGRDHGGADHWGELQVIRPSQTDTEDAFGTAVALAGSVAVAGAPYVKLDVAGDDHGAAFLIAAVGGAGEPCTEDFECASRECSDGVCCDDDCGGGDPDDCRACSVAAGGTVDGTCADRVEGEACADGVFCNGTESCAAGVCGSSSGYPCVGPDGDEDCAETCDEAQAACTGVDPDGSMCATGLGSCDNGQCLRPNGTECAQGDQCETGNCVGEICCAEAECSPYVCGTQGTCLNACTSAVDCLPGYDCTSASQCVPAPSAVAADDDGCGCRLPRPARPRAAPLVAMSLLGLVLARRRRAVRLHAEVVAPKERQRVESVTGLVDDPQDLVDG